MGYCARRVDGFVEWKYDMRLIIHHHLHPDGRWQWPSCHVWVTNKLQGAEMVCLGAEDVLGGQLEGYANGGRTWKNMRKCGKCGEIRKMRLSGSMRNYAGKCGAHNPPPPGYALLQLLCRLLRVVTPWKRREKKINPKEGGETAEQRNSHVHTIQWKAYRHSAGMGHILPRKCQKNSCDRPWNVIECHFRHKKIERARMRSLVYIPVKKICVILGGGKM